MNTPDQLTQPPAPNIINDTGGKETHKVAHLLEALGAALILAVLGALVYWYARSPDAPAQNGDIVLTPEMKQEMMDAMTKRAEDVPAVSASEKQNMIDAMKQKAPTSTMGTVSGTTPPPPAPTISAEEKQKMIDAMKQTR